MVYLPCRENLTTEKRKWKSEKHTQPTSQSCITVATCPYPSRWKRCFPTSTKAGGKSKANGCGQLHGVFRHARRADQHKYIFHAMERYAEEAARVADLAEGKLMEEMLAEVREEIRKENA